MNMILSRSRHEVTVTGGDVTGDPLELVVVAAGDVSWAPKPFRSVTRRLKLTQFLIILP